jgi:hypothetical protein
MALLIGYLKRGDETSAEEDWVESEVWRAVSLAVESTATDDDDSSDVDDDLPVVDGLSAEGRLPENACDHESKHLFPERSSEDLAARDVAQVWFLRSIICIYCGHTSSIGSPVDEYTLGFGHRRRQHFAC